MQHDNASPLHFPLAPASPQRARSRDQVGSLTGCLLPPCSRGGLQPGKSWSCSSCPRTRCPRGAPEPDHCSWALLTAGAVKVQTLQGSSGGDVQIHLHFAVPAGAKPVGILQGSGCCASRAEGAEAAPAGALVHPGCAEGPGTLSSVPPRHGHGVKHGS